MGRPSSVVNALSKALDLEIKTEGASTSKSYRARRPAGQAEAGRGGLDQENRTKTRSGRRRDLRDDRVRFRDPDPADAEAELLNRGIRIPSPTSARGSRKISNTRAASWSSSSTEPERGCPESPPDLFESQKDDIIVELASSTHAGYNDSIFTFSNNINTHRAERT